MVKKQGFLYGSAVLMISAVLVKLIGALFKIPLANILGGTGMGYFSAAYSIFMPVYAISVTGLPTAVAKCTANRLAVGQEYEAVRVKKISLRVFGLAGVAASLVILFGAYPFCKYVSCDMSALPAVAAIAPSVLAGCLISVYRGYYEGKRNMYPTAISQVIESVVKLVCGLGAAYLCLWLASSRPQLFVSILGLSDSGVDASLAAVPYSAAAAVMGITVASFSGLLYLMITDRRSERSTVEKGSRVSERTLLSELLKIALPAAIGALVINLSSLIDLVTIIRSLNKIVRTAPRVFDELVAAGISPSMIPNFIYGSFTGLAVTIFNLIPSITNMFGKSMLPAAAAAKAKGDNKRLGDCAYVTLLSAAVVSIPAGIGIFVMAKPALNLLFSQRQLEIKVCADSLAVLGMAVPFLSISSAAFTILQAADRADIPVRLMGVGAVVKLVGNLILVSVPEINVTGAALSTLICYIVICAFVCIDLKRYAHMKMKTFFVNIVKITAAAICCGAGAFLMYNALVNSSSELLRVAGSCLFGAVIYIIITYFAGVISKSTLKVLIS